MLKHIELSIGIVLVLGACTSAPPRETAPAPTTMPARETTPSRERLDAIASELREMGHADQDGRKTLIEAEKQEHDGAHVEELRHQLVGVDEKNVARLKSIIAEIGWPRRSVVGPQAAQSAWLIAQHASDHEFQAQVLELLRPLLDEGEVTKPAFAMLDDRVRCHRGEPQVYGTQYRKKVVDGVVHFGPLTPIVDPEHVDERRAAMGLEPQATYIVALRRMFNIGDDAVIDP